ncbi:hypothetical protein J6590_015265 [Homalodisca vitripennis]|nr:hypothetical protein J6590_015265 [Homalodisca vitripennis]
MIPKHGGEPEFSTCNVAMVGSVDSIVVISSDERCFIDIRCVNKSAGSVRRYQLTLAAGIVPLVTNRCTTGPTLRHLATAKVYFLRVCGYLSVGKKFLFVMARGEVDCCSRCNKLVENDSKMRETCNLDNLIHLTQAFDKLFGLVQTLVDDNNLVKEFVFNSNKTESGIKKQRQNKSSCISIESPKNLDCDEKVIQVEEKDIYAEKVVRGQDCEDETHTTTNEIENYMKQNGVGDIRCEKIQTRYSDYSSFKETLESILLSENSYVGNTYSLAGPGLFELPAFGMPDF